MKKFLLYNLILLFSCNIYSQWNLLNPPPTSQHLYSLHLLGNTSGWAVGNQGTMLRTTNGGLNWTSQNSSTVNLLSSVYFKDDSTGWAVGRSGKIIKSTNGGVNWLAQTSGTTSDLYFVFCIFYKFKYRLGCR